MFDTLLLRPSLHCNTLLHFTTLQFNGTLKTPKFYHGDETKTHLLASRF